MIGNAFSNNYIDCENDGVKIKTLTKNTLKKLNHI